MRFVRQVCIPAAVLVAAAGVVGLAQQRGAAQGQQPPPTRALVQVTQVKPDMVSTYEDLIKRELVPVQKKAGVAYRWTYANGPMGGTAFTYVAVTPITSLAQFDGDSPAQKAMGAAPFAAYQSKVRATMVSQQSYVETLRADLSIVSASSTPAPLVQVQVLQLGAGKGDEFTRIMTTDFLPNYKKAGVTDFMVYATNFGDVPAGQLVTVRGLAKYADLEGLGLLRRAGVTAEAAAQLNARRALTFSGVSNVVMRLIPDMSFGAPTRPTSQ